MQKREKSMINHKITFTDEDIAIINSQNPDTVSTMLVADTIDSMLMRQWEEEKISIRRQQWEMDNIY